MIACPKCGGPTLVSETRNVGPSRVRRRRVCTAVACGERISTVELPLDDGARQKQVLAVIPKRALVEAHRALEQALAAAGETS